MRFVCVVLLALLVSELQANPALAQGLVEQTTDSPPLDVINPPATERPPVGWQKIPTEEEKMELFCETEENRENPGCRTVGGE